MKKIDVEKYFIACVVFMIILNILKPPILHIELFNNVKIGIYILILIETLRLAVKTRKNKIHLIESKKLIG
jgi:uncharacterized protein YhhL (DUF1145 family)